MSDSVVIAQLDHIREWARAKLAEGAEGPWAWRYRDIIAIVADIQSAHAAAVAPDDPREGVRVCQDDTWVSYAPRLPPKLRLVSVNGVLI